MPQKRRRHSRPLVRIGVSALLLSLVVSMCPIIGFADDAQGGSRNPADQTPLIENSAPEFPDVDYSNWYGNAVTFVASKGLITGYTDGPKAGLFGVGDTLTRAQLATILWRNARPDEYATYDPTTAVDTTGIEGSADGMYYTAAANWAVREGIITGFKRPDGTFDFAADVPVSFEQMMTIIARTYASINDPAAEGDLSAFVDGADASEWSYRALAWAHRRGLVTGYDEPDGKYLRPGEPVKRERAAMVLMRAFQLGIME